jgi:hypothetical protein
MKHSDLYDDIIIFAIVLLISSLAISLVGLIWALIIML